MQSPDLWKHDFRAFGFPHGYPNGVWASGRILGPEATGWYQIEGTKQTGYFVQPGFSGGAVWDDALGGVVGLVVAADIRQDTRAAFLLPVERLAERFPELRAQVKIIPPGDGTKAVGAGGVLISQNITNIYNQTEKELLLTIR